MTIKDTSMLRTYSGIKQRATGYVYLNGSPYCDAKGSSHLRSCLRHAINNAVPIIGGNIDKLKLYRQCTPRRMKDKHLKELENANMYHL